MFQITFQVWKTNQSLSALTFWFSRLLWRRLGSPSHSRSWADPQEESSNFRNKLVLKPTQLEVTIEAENDYSRQMNSYTSTLEIKIIMLEGEKKSLKYLLEISKYPVYVLLKCLEVFYLDSKPNLNVMFTCVLGPKLLFTLVHKVIFSCVTGVYPLQNTEY